VRIAVLNITTERVLDAVGVEDEVEKELSLTQ